MPERYPLSKCYELLDIDPKTFRKWIEKAGWQNLLKQQKSKADDRVKYLTEEQLKKLAELHERVLALPEQKPTLPASSYNLLIDQIDEVRTVADNAFSQAHEAWRTIDAVRERYEKELTALHALVEEQGKAWQQLSTLQSQQYEALATLIRDQQQALNLQKASLAEQDSRQEIRVSELSHTVEQFQQETLTNLQAVATASKKDRQELEGHSSQIGALQNQAQHLEAEMHRQIEQIQTQVQTQLDRTRSRRDSRLKTLTEQMDLLSSTQLSLQHQVDALTTTQTTVAEQRQGLQEPVNQLAAALVTETEQEQQLQSQTSPLASALTSEKEQRQELADQVTQRAEASQCTQSSEKKPTRRRRSSPPLVQ